MLYREKVKQYNPVAYQLIKNAFNSDKVSHAFLFSAPVGSPIEDEPRFLIQSLISEDPFTSNDLRNIESYSDLQIVDGSDGLIKKEFVIDAMSNLSRTALERSGKKILWIKNVENTNKQSLNSLLKFIEEPSDNTHIIMTTNNISQVLNTIKSRSQIISLRDVTHEQLVHEFNAAGIEHNHARVLANLNHTLEDAKQMIDQGFEGYYESFLDIMNESLDDKGQIYTRPVNVVTKDNYHIIFGLMRVFANDIWKYYEGLPISFIGHEDLLERYHRHNFNYSKAIKAVNDFFVKQSSHVNFDLYKSKTLLDLKECYE